MAINKRRIKVETLGLLADENNPDIPGFPARQHRSKEYAYLQALKQEGAKQWETWCSLMTALVAIACAIGNKRAGFAKYDAAAPVNKVKNPAHEAKLVRDAYAKRAEENPAKYDGVNKPKELPELLGTPEPGRRTAVSADFDMEAVSEVDLSAFVASLNGTQDDSDDSEDTESEAAPESDEADGRIDAVIEGIPLAQ